MLALWEMRITTIKLKLSVSLHHFPVAVSGDVDVSGRQHCMKGVVEA